MPQAKPIISDDTVAALIGAIVWPKVTFTGSVDCSRNPPADNHGDERPAVEGAAPREERNRRNQRQDDDPPAPNRSASRPPKNPPGPTANR